MTMTVTVTVARIVVLVMVTVALCGKTTHALMLGIIGRRGWENAVLRGFPATSHASCPIMLITKACEVLLEGTLRFLEGNACLFFEMSLPSR